MHPKYPNVFSPFRLGPVELKNRFYSSPHAVPLNWLGAPTPDYVEYVATRARGGCGLIILSMAALHRAKSIWPCPHPDENVPAFRALADAVHAAGGKIFGEPWYFWGQPGQWQPFSPPAPALSPSVSQFSYLDRRATTREMTKDEIRRMVATFAESTANLREAGFDGVMMHVSHGAVLEQFLSPYFNRRTDEYGGSLENRMRIVMETLEAVRAAAGPQMAVGLRLNCDELLEGGYRTSDAYQFLQRIAHSGLIDYVDLDVAIEPDQFWMGMPPVFLEKQVYRPYVEQVREAAGKVPVLCVMGRLTSIAEAEAVLASGVCDLVGAARALIAEPELVNHARDGLEDRSRTCIACNWCLEALLDGAQTCTVNPTAWRERYWGEGSITPAATRAKTIVVGGGPAGLEAARVAALRGHEVELWEARDRLGGALALWASLPGREFFLKSVEWWERELRRLGVTIQLGTTATAAAILEREPDAVILATGALYSREGHSNFRDLPIAGHDRAFVCRPEDVLLGAVRPSGKVVILDGEGINAGVGVAEVLAGRGCTVEFLTPGLSPVSGRVHAAEEGRFIIRRLHAAGVKVSPSTYVRTIGEGELLAYDVVTEEERVIAGVDTLVLATGRMAVNTLEQELEGKVAQLFPIGDAVSARMWATASYEGHLFARFIGEPDAPRSLADVYFGGDEVQLMALPEATRRALQPS
ncbi:NAD(P)-binding protein [Phenylobacterium sp. LjRoot219]|uniref:oxidoreductase n=1 Tax=Phenylobacterium sp. LjRoot219 TaxID=3342283 RepID=UPI003ECD5578